MTDRHEAALRAALAERDEIAAEPGRAYTTTWDVTRIVEAALAAAALPNLERNRLAEAFIRGIEAGAEEPTLAGDGDAMYAAFRQWVALAAADEHPCGAKCNPPLHVGHGLVVDTDDPRVHLTGEPDQ